jgi:hypothetical protein
MAQPDDAAPNAEGDLDTKSPFTEIRYSLPTLLREVKRDRASTAFAMEKLDQAAINTLFEQQRARRDPGARSQ